MNQREQPILENSLLNVISLNWLQFNSPLGGKAIKDLLDYKVSVVVQSEQSLGQMGVAESTSSPQVFLIISKIIHKAMFP